MTNPRAQAQQTKTPLVRRLRVGLKRFFGPWGMFVRGFIKHPVMVGSIVPSSPTLIRHMLRPVDWKNTRSEEHTSELQSLMRNTYAVFCLKKKTNEHKQYQTK